MDMDRRQALVGVSAAVATLALTPPQSFALEEFSPVTYKEATGLGMKFRAQKFGSPNAVWVELSFEFKGKLEGIRRVTLRGYDGDKLLLFATLGNDGQVAGQFKAGVTLDRDLLAKSAFWVSSSLGGASVGGAHVLKLSDIEEVKALR